MQSLSIESNTCSPPQESDEINNVNVTAEEILITPEALKGCFPQTGRSRNTILHGRQTVRSILDRSNPALLAVVGPCSIHDMQSAREYAKRLKDLHDELQDTIYLVMRVYFEKPRTTVGWKGFINDPYMDDSFRIQEGLEKAREFLLWLAELGLPAGTELLDTITPQYLSDLFCWAAIGARTTESQTHRELASGLSMPVGFKNATDGSVEVAINAMHAAATPHSFLGINQEGQVTVIRTRGNTCSHVILRGGKEPNYDSVCAALCEQGLEKSGLRKNLMIDCSHGNSKKNYELQPLVADNVANQIIEGNRSIIGFMLESHLHAGNQSVPEDRSQLRYGVSITDACIDWETTETLLRGMYSKIKPMLAQR